MARLMDRPICKCEWCTEFRARRQRNELAKIERKFEDQVKKEITKPVSDHSWHCNTKLFSPLALCDCGSPVREPTETIDEIADRIGVSRSTAEYLDANENEAYIIEYATQNGIDPERVLGYRPSITDKIAKNTEAYKDRIGSAAERKAVPLCSGVLDYFPDALLAVAALSKVGNDQHNPGEELHWARGKSGDECDALLRHVIDRGTVDSDGVRHSVKLAWRALANLQKELEKELGLPLSRGSRPAPK